MLIAHTNMSKNNICNSSLPFIFAIYNRLTRRLCEKLGIPYENSNNISQDKHIDANLNDSGLSDDMYPESIKRKLEGKKTIENETSNVKTYDASKKSDWISFFTD